jgi:hypothetical protein
MPITQSLATLFKVDLLDGVHNFGTAPIRATTAADTFKIALYTSSATLGPSTTVYTTSNEVSGAGYTAGGNVLSISTAPTSGGTTAFLSFSNTTWAAATITARGALIYNSTQGNLAVAIFDFGSDKSTVSGDFTIVFPTADASNAVIRIA